MDDLSRGQARTVPGQLRICGGFEAYRSLLRFDVNLRLDTVHWRFDVYEGHHGDVVGSKELSDRPLIGLPDELAFACQELGLELQGQLHPYHPSWY